MKKQNQNWDGVVTFLLNSAKDVWFVGFAGGGTKFVSGFGMFFNESSCFLETIKMFSVSCYGYNRKLKENAGRAGDVLCERPIFISH